MARVNLFVTTLGDDSNDGLSVETAFRTIKQAGSELQTGYVGDDAYVYVGGENHNLGEGTSWSNTPGCIVAEKTSCASVTYVGDIYGTYTGIPGWPKCNGVFVSHFAPGAGAGPTAALTVRNFRIATEVPGEATGIYINDAAAVPPSPIVFDGLFADYVDKDPLEVLGDGWYDIYVPSYARNTPIVVKNCYFKSFGRRPSSAFDTPQRHCTYWQTVSMAEPINGPFIFNNTWNLDRIRNTVVHHIHHSAAGGLVSNFYHYNNVYVNARNMSVVVIYAITDVVNGNPLTGDINLYSDNNFYDRTFLEDRTYQRSGSTIANYPYFTYHYGFGICAYPYRPAFVDGEGGPCKDTYPGNLWNLHCYDGPGNARINIVNMTSAHNFGLELNSFHRDFEDFDGSPDFAEGSVIRTKASSVLIDNGWRANWAEPSGVWTDIYGSPRPFRLEWDMGPYEWSGTPVIRVQSGSYISMTRNRMELDHVPSDIEEAVSADVGYYNSLFFSMNVMNVPPKFGTGATELEPHWNTVTEENPGHLA